MTSSPNSTYTTLKSSRSVLLLVLCALGVCSFTILGGVLVLNSTRTFMSTGEWLDHTHSVLDTLQSSALRVERIQYGMQLFGLDRDDDSYRIALNSAVALNASAVRLQELVQDNASQSAHAKELGITVQALSRAVDNARAERTIPETQMRDCRTVINVMQTEERNLLEQRLVESRRAVLRPLFWGAAYLGFSLLVLIVLFAILIRDAIRRRQSEGDLSLANHNLATTVEALGNRVREAMLLKTVRDELQLCVSAQEAYDCSVRHLNRLLPGSSGAMLVINNSRSLAAPTATWNQPVRLLESCEAHTCCGLRTGRPRWRKAGESEVDCNHFHGTPPDNYMCIPLSALGETLGFAYVELPTAAVSALAESRLLVINEMIELSAMAIAGLNLRAKLENQSIRDGLTTLFNRHFLEIALERELRRASRNGATLALLMMDVDHFKSFNDRFGHEAGDVILRELAQCLKGAVRIEDLVCRYGGEEFVILLPDISREMALVTAERIRERVAAMRIHLHGEPLSQISISIGLATYPETAFDADELLRMADRAMYQAKHGGRNQVKMISAPDTVEMMQPPDPSFLIPAS